MKSIRYIWIAAAALLPAITAGCGGGGGTNDAALSKATTGRATITILWPVKSRLIPLATSSITVAVLQGASTFTQQTVTAPTGGGPATVSFSSLPVGTLTVTGTAYPNANGTGVPLATGSSPLVIQPSQNTTFSITMNSTITHVVVGPGTPAWNGRTQPLSATAYDAANNMVLTTPAKWNWSSKTTGVATVTSGANPTMLTGVSVGQSQITATETESGISSTATITVVQPGPAPLPWAKYQANSANSGQGSGSGATGALKWSFLTGGTIYSAMAIGADTTVYLGSSDGNLYALTSAGTRKWTFTTGGQVSCPAIGSDGTIYIGSGDGNIYGVNLDGSEKWAYNTGTGIYSNPVIGSDGTVYAASYRGFMTAVDGLTGTKKWTFTTGSLIYGSPAIGPDGTIYIGCDNIAANTNTPTNELFAVSPAGSQKWTYSNGYGIDASAAVGTDGTVYFSTYDNTLHAVNSSGTQTWSYTFSTGVHGPTTVPAISSADGTIYFGTSEGHLFSLTSAGVFNWSFALAGPFATAPAIGGDGTVYVGFTNSTTGTTGEFYALSKAGSQKWIYNSGPVNGSSAVSPDGTIYTTDGPKMLAIK